MSKKTDKTKALEKNPMMDHLLSALDDGEDIGHYGRFVFAVVARHFMEPDDLVQTLAHDEDFSEAQAKSLVHQVIETDYSPPGPAKIREFQQKQDFPLVPEGHDTTDDANVYQDLTFPDHVYDKISQYHEEKADATGVGG